MATNYHQIGQQWFNALVDEIHDKARKAVQDAVEEGANITKHNIENSGTLKSGKRGRIETGAMRDAVSSGIIADNDEAVIGRFGWASGPGYAKFQEQGFQHVSGVSVEGMFALSDAAVEVAQNLEKELDL